MFQQAQGCILSFFSVEKGNGGEEAGMQFIQSVTDTCWGIISKSYSEAAPNTGPAGLGTEEGWGWVVGVRNNRLTLLLIIPSLNYQGHLEACSPGCCGGKS